MGHAREPASTERAKRQEHDARERLPTAPTTRGLGAGGGGLERFGNRALLGLLRSGALQRKGRVSDVRDPLEHQADQVADEVMMDGPVATTPRPGRDIPGLQRMPTTDDTLAATLGLGSYGSHSGRSPRRPTRRPGSAVSSRRGCREATSWTTAPVGSWRRASARASATSASTRPRCREIANFVDARAFTVGEDIVFAERRVRARDDRGTAPARA